MTNHYKRILVAVAHPDDEVLGCAGFLMNSTARKHVCYFNNGNQLRSNPKDIERQSRTVCEKVNASFGTLGLASARFDTYPQLDINQKFEGVLRSFKPDLVLTHFEKDLHVDHVIVSRTVRVGCRAMKASDSIIPDVWEFPVISSSSNHYGNELTANAYVPMTRDQVQKKVDLMKLYKDEYEALKEARGESSIFTWAKFYGYQCGHEFAEPYMITRMTTKKI